jgi:hypothetical protein
MAPSAPAFAGGYEFGRGPQGVRNFLSIGYRQVFGESLQAATTDIRNRRFGRMGSALGEARTNNS